jgi:23S rRNA pseudouridine955/2504/2580 synthase
MPIYGDGKYGTAERGVRLHLHARRLSLAHPLTGRRLELTAPLPPHMLTTWGLCGWDDGARPTPH